MNVNSDLKYTTTHEWVRFLEKDKVQVGISDFAQAALGDIVFIGMPQIGDEVTAGETLCDIESVKSAESIISPVSGKITAVNEELTDELEKISSDPYGSWFVEISGVTGLAELMDAAAYKAFCAKMEE